jgi:hypothetical protein
MGTARARARIKAASMNWSRGFLRLWIVASFLWGAISVVLFWPTSEVADYIAYWHLRLFQIGLFRDAEGSRTQIEKIFEAENILDKDSCRDYTATSLDNLRFDESHHIPHQVTAKELDYIFCSSAQKTLDTRTAYQKTLEPTVQILNTGESIGAESIVFIEVTLLPPFVVLMIGSGLFWVIRGFRGKPGNTS